MFYAIGSYSVFPRQAYNPADLDPAGHMAVVARLERAARWWGLGEEAAEEAAHQFYAHWLGRNWGKTAIPRGDHARAIASVMAFAKRSHWHGFTGQRRQYRGKRIPRDSAGNPVRVSVAKACAAELAQQERLRERNNPTPDAVAVAVERIATSPKYGRKAYRLARKLGLPGVRELVREACGFPAE